MKILSKSEATRVQIGSTCEALEYEMGDKDINGAIIHINGRSPEKGRVVNNVCKEMVYILSGSGKTEIEGKEMQLASGDLLIVEPGEKYFWEGNMTLFTPCTPPWTAEQSAEVA